MTPILLIDLDHVVKFIEAEPGERQWLRHRPHTLRKPVSHGRHPHFLQLRDGRIASDPRKRNILIGGSQLCLVLTVHNVTFMNRLMAGIRDALAAGRRTEARRAWLGAAA